MSEGFRDYVERKAMTDHCGEANKKMTDHAQHRARLERAIDDMEKTTICLDIFDRAMTQSRAQGRREEREKIALEVCDLCRDAYPLQPNGLRHNDKRGKDTLVNNSCKAVQIRAKAKEVGQ